MIGLVTLPESGTFAFTGSLKVGFIWMRLIRFRLPGAGIGWPFLTAMTTAGTRGWWLISGTRKLVQAFQF